MTGGASGLKGYVYQQDYAAYRLLASEAKRLLIPNDVGECVASFKIEGSQRKGGPVWDVAWRFENGLVDLRECKDTAITRTDRKTFYRRIRDEINSGTGHVKLRIGWVTDKHKQTGVLQSLREMAGIALDDRQTVPCAPPSQVRSGRAALKEALYYMSHAAASQSQPIALDHARALLSNLSFDHYSSEELASSLEWISPAIFESGTGSAIRDLIQGKLSTTIQRLGVVEHTRLSFLAELNLSQLALELAGQLRDALKAHSATAQAAPTGIQWINLPDSSQKIWPLRERLEDWDEHRSCVVIARTGAGKTTASLQMCAERSTHLDKNHVLRVEASEVDKDLVRLLPRLCCLLSGVSASWLVVDGLDQIPRSIDQTWRQTLARLLQLPKLTVVLNARQEVVATNEWMQRLVSRLPELTLRELSIEEVAGEFDRVGLVPPRNTALLDYLKNPFLLSIYARTVTEAEMPLEDQGEVTAFDVIRVYWQRRVLPESEGFRSTDDTGESATAKRAAASHLANRTLTGESVFEGPTDNSLVANGIEILCREGVLVRLGTNSATWSHSWLREFAAADKIIGGLNEPTARSIVSSICGIQHDHARRLAAVGCCKWIVSELSEVRIEDYLSAIYERNTGAARDAIAVLVEGATRNLNISALTPELALEVIAQARDILAPQWQGQIANLPDAFFEIPEGPELLRTVVSYELEVMGHD